MTERRSYTEIWVIAAILLAVVLIARLPQAATVASGGDNARITAVMGGARRVLSNDVRRTDVTTIMGGTRIDLRKVELRPGEELVVNILTVMGGVTLLVPDGWTVDAQAVPVLGGLEDVRVPAEWADERPAANAAGPAPRLVLHGAVLMGGVRITS